MVLGLKCDVFSIILMFGIVLFLFCYILKIDLSSNMYIKHFGVFNSSPHNSFSQKH